jgi:hypothetical protein
VPYKAVESWLYSYFDEQEKQKMELVKATIALKKQ